MSTQKKQKVNTTNRQLLYRLKRLPIVHQISISELIAYVGLLLVNHGDTIDYPSALRIIHKSNLHKKIEANSAIPTTNLLEALIYLVIYKRNLVNEFINNQDYEVWSDEIAAPLFDIIQELSEIYKV